MKSLITRPRLYYGLCALALAASLPMLWALSTLAFNHRVESLFPADDPEVQYYQQLSSAFGQGETVLAIAVVHRAGIFRADFLQRLDAFTLGLGDIAGICEVSSLTNATLTRIGPMGIRNERPVVHPYAPARLARDSALVDALPPFRYGYYAPDTPATCLYVRIEAGSDPDAVMAGVAARVQACGLEAVHFAGSFYADYMQQRRLRREMLLFTTLTLGLLALLLYLAFRNAWAVVLPLLLVLLSGVWTLGLMALVGVRLHLMTMMIPSILFVVATSDVIHLLSRFGEALQAGASRVQAVQITLREVGLTTLLTSLTTALGFLTLWYAGVQAFEEFGIFAALGTLLAYLLTVAVLPALLLHIPIAHWQGFCRQLATWQQGLGRLYDSIATHRPSILWGGALLGVLSVAGLSQLELRYFLRDELLPRTPEGRDLRFFEAAIGGIRPFVLGVEAQPGQRITDVAAVRDLARVEAYLDTIYGVRRLYSLAGQVKAAHCAMNFGRPQAYTLPGDDDELARLLLLMRLYGAPLHELVSADSARTRIIGSLPDLGIAAAARQRQAFEVFVADSLACSPLRFRLSGPAELLDKGTGVLTFNMMQSLGLALALVSLLMGLLYRTWRATLIAIIPNVLPLMLIAGLLALSGIGLKMSTAIIFTIALGIAVDDTIHYMGRLHVELRKGLPLAVAHRKTFCSTGKALILTSAVLMSGFAVLTLSGYQSTLLTGALVCSTLLLALLADLVLLPALIMTPRR
ncbi:MAG: hypothetical protein OHK0039_13880 [Bacteroidia bacterium]